MDSPPEGTAEVRNALETNFGSVTDQQPQITSVVSQGDTVVLLGREQGNLRATGERYDVQFVHKFTFDDGRLASVQIIAAKNL